MTYYMCPCCGYKTIDQPNAYEICPICFWEDDCVQLQDPLYEGGANTVSLYDAQRNFEKYGACDSAFIHEVRKPNENDVRDTQYAICIHPDIAEILHNWIAKINADEFHFAHAFDALIARKTEVEAFEFTPYLLEAALLAYDDFIVSQLLFYLNCMYGKANTTEIHYKVLDKLPLLEQHVLQLNGHYAEQELNEFKRDLRLV